jgi:hypothetical protein
MTLLWLLIWFVVGHEPLIFNPVNAWTATLILALGLDLSRAGGFTATRALARSACAHARTPRLSTAVGRATAPAPTRDRHHRGRHRDHSTEGDARPSEPPPGALRNSSHLSSRALRSVEKRSASASIGTSGVIGRTTTVASGSC